MRRECQCLGEAGPPLTPGACSAQPDRQLRGLQGCSRIPPASPKEASPWEWTQLNGFSGGHLASPAGLSLFLSIEADVPRVFLAGFSPPRRSTGHCCAWECCCTDAAGLSLFLTGHFLTLPLKVLLLPTFQNPSRSLQVGKDCRVIEAWHLRDSHRERELCLSGH